MVASNLLLALVGVPFVAAVLIFLVPARTALLRLIEAVHVVSIAWVLLAGGFVVLQVVDGATPSAYGGWFMVDALGAIFLGLIAVVGCLTGVYSLSYIRHDLAHQELDPPRFKLYYGFFNLFLSTMLLSVMSNNIVVMWVAIEATTLGSTFLVGLYGKKSSLEAAWKYVVICTVGVAFGLYGTVLAYANGTDVLGTSDSAILWTTLASHAASLDPVVAKLSFVFVLIGFGTKAGLFPMHAWLPDAHSEAPSPVSALMSGVLLKCAFLVIIRYYVITTRAVGADFPQLLLMTLGMLSIAVSAFIIAVQHDFKRKLAYHSIEHLGLIALGLGIGGPLGAGAALLHVINHSFTKALLFCGAGNVLQKFGTRDLEAVKGILRVAPATGLLIMGGALALAGVPPFNVFVSEFLVFVAGVKAGYTGLMIVCALLFTITVAALIQIVAGSVLGKPAAAVAAGEPAKGTLTPMVVLFGLILLFGVAIPRPVSHLIETAATLVGGEAAAPIAIATPWQAASAAADTATTLAARTASHSEMHP